MFDADYFRTSLARDVQAMGDDPIVEIHLVTGQAHRVRGVVEVGDKRVTLDAYLGKGDLAHSRPRYGQSDAESEQQERFRAVISYESIVAVVLDPSRPNARARTGFASQ